jgi:outer membrane usher protein FimD/PapC
MNNIKSIFYIIPLVVNGSIYANEQYFNPQFLGKDASLIQDLTLLTNGSGVTPGSYYLDLYIEGRFIKNVKVNFYNRDTEVYPCITENIIDLIPLNKDTKKSIEELKKVNGCFELNQVIPEVNYNVDVPKLEFSISIPQIYLDKNKSSLANEADWDSGISAALVNYNFSGINSYNENSEDYSSYYLTLSNKINIGNWRMYGNVYWSQNKFGSDTESEFKSNGIYLSRDINSLKSTLTVGQNSLGSNLFDALQYIGATLASSNEMRPENENGYTPPIKGIASVRSKLTIRQNNLIIYQTFIDPGPYDIKDLYPVGSSGDYEVELTSLDGAIIEKYNIPYATLPNLLKTNNYTYSATFGELDLPSTKAYKFLQGSFSYGLPFRATVYGGIQGYNDYLSFGLGLAKDLGRFGALSVDVVNANSSFSNELSRINGQSYRILFAKSFTGTKTNIQLTGYKYSTSGFYTLNEAAYKNSNIGENNYLLSRRRSTFQVNVSQNLGDFGQLYVWGTKSTYWGGSDYSKNIQVGWNKTLPKLNGLMVSLNYNMQKNNDLNNNSIGLSLMMPLDFRKSKNMNSYISNNTTYYEESKSFTNNVNLYGRTQDNKLNYGLLYNYNENSDDTANLNLKYDANIADLTFGTSYSKNATQINYGVSGSLLLHDHNVSLFKQAYDTNILIEAKGASGAKILKAGDNILVNKQGYALIPFATPYRYNDVEIDVESFKNGYDINDKILKVAPTRGAIAKVTFDVENGYSFLVRPKLNEENIKFGTIVENEENKTTTISNDDGTVYIPAVKNGAKYKVYWSKTQVCEFSIQYDDNEKLKNINKKDVICEERPNE